MKEFDSPVIFALGGTSGAAVAQGLLAEGIESFGEVVTIVSSGDDGGATCEQLNIFGGSAAGDVRKVFSHFLSDQVVREGLEARVQPDVNNNPFGLTLSHPLGSLVYVALKNGLSIPIEHYRDRVDSCIVSSAKDLMRSHEQQRMTGEKALKIMGDAFELPKNVTVLPMTRSRTGVVARFMDGRSIAGESQIGHRELDVEHAFAEKVEIFDYHISDPLNNRYFPAELTDGVIDAIKSARHIVIGPGSIETTRGQLLGDRRISHALRLSGAPLSLVLNIVGRHHMNDEVDFVERHIGENGRIGSIIANNSVPADSDLAAEFVRINPLDSRVRASSLYRIGIPGIDPDKRTGIGHDAASLGRALSDVLGVAVRQSV